MESSLLEGGRGEKNRKGERERKGRKRERGEEKGEEGRGELKEWVVWEGRKGTKWVHGPPPPPGRKSTQDGHLSLFVNCHQ